jgi:hypothetical protein
LLNGGRGMSRDYAKGGGVLWNLIQHAKEVARLNTLLNHISYLSTPVQHDIEKANNVLLAIHETAAGKITTEEEE